MVEESDAALDRVFHALGDTSRRRMLHLLAESDRTITELAQPFNMSFAAVSKHVKSLEHAGLVRRNVHGRTHVIHLQPLTMAKAQRFLDFYQRLWSEQLDKLEALLQKKENEQ
jgi:DNA-binding transcriptional ArsR family regulator